jgi:opine dehydrogenase
MKVAVLGAGHGGQAMAADLTLAGHEVRFAAVPEHAKNLVVIKAFGGIFLEGSTSTGKPPGFAKIHMITDDVPAAVKGAEIVMIVVPAFAQESYMRVLVECAEPGQLIVFNPGKFGALAFAKMLLDAKRYGEILIGETDTLIYAARMKGAGHTWIMGVKSDLYYSAFPSVDTAITLSMLLDLFPQFSPAKNIFQTSVDDVAMTLHPITTLMNTSRIELMGPYKNSHYDITPSIGRVIEVVDNERIELAKKLRYETLDYYECYEMEYGVKGKTVYEVIRNVSAYGVMSSPDSIKHRYVTEEIPYGLVPVAELAKIAGITTPGTDCFIQLASMANEVDYRREGRSLAAMGLEGLDIAGLINYVTYGPARSE